MSIHSRKSRHHFCSAYQVTTNEESKWLVRIILKDLGWNVTTRRMFACIDRLLNPLYAVYVV